MDAWKVLPPSKKQRDAGGLNDATTAAENWLMRMVEQAFWMTEEQKEQWRHLRESADSGDVLLVSLPGRSLEDFSSVGKTVRSRPQPRPQLRLT